MTVQAEIRANGYMSRARTRCLQIGIAKLVGNVVLFALFASLSWWALKYPPLARIFPLSIGILGSLMSLANLALDITRRIEVAKVKKVEGEEEEYDPENSGPASANEVRAAGWIVGYSFLIWVLGFEVATAVYIVTILKFEAKASYRLGIISAVITVACILAFSHFFDVRFPEPLLAPLYAPLWALF
jgi:hypothetical protein